MRRSADAQRLLVLQALREVAADLVLARARADRRLRRAEQRGHARRPLEQRDVAERAPRFRRSGESAPGRVRIRTGRSDHGGCRASHAASGAFERPARCSSAISTAAAPSLQLATSCVDAT